MRTPVTELSDPLVTVRPVNGLTEFRAVERLYTDVMHLRPDDGSINPRLLIALQHNSGLVLGAYSGATMVGFTYSFLAREPDGTLYQYSQTAAVAESVQGRGVGRALKSAQRDAALAMGVHRIRLAYDPMRSRNAHVNLDVLGAVADRFEPDLYGPEGFGADARDRTDRLVVRWDLDRQATPAPDLPSVVSWRTGGSTGGLLTVPADWSAWRDRVGPAAASALRGRVAAALRERLAAGEVAVSCRRVDSEYAVYSFAPDSGR